MPARPPRAHRHTCKYQGLEQTGSTFEVLEQSNKRLAAAREELHAQNPLFRASARLLRTMKLHSVLDWVRAQEGRGGCFPLSHL